MDGPEMLSTVAHRERNGQCKVNIMSVYLFGMTLLSLAYGLVFGMWWGANAPFTAHMAMLTVLMIVVLSAILILALRSKSSSRDLYQSESNNAVDIDWGSEIPSRLSTPAAVLEGHTLTFANDAFLAELGMSGIGKQIAGIPLANLVHSSDHITLNKFLAKTALDSEPIGTLTVKLRFRHANGTTLPIHISLSPLRELADSYLYLLQLSAASSYGPAVAHIEDQSEYRLLIDKIEQVVFHLDVERKILFLNSSWEHFTGYSAASSLNKPFDAFVHPEDMSMFETRTSALTQGKRSHCHLQMRLITKDGKAIWFELRAKTTSSFKGERSSIVATLSDINRMKSMENILRARRRSLGALLNDVPGFVYRCKNNRYWSFEFVSDGCLDVTGYEPYEMLDKPNFAFTRIIHPDDRDRIWECVQQQVAKQQKFQMVYRLITRAGGVKWAWEQGNGVFSSTGELLALEGFITSIANHGDYETMMGLQKLLSDPADVPLLH